MTVPPLVLIHVEPGALVVTTNTARAPARTDTFYLVRPGRAEAAPHGLVTLVLRRCG